MSRHPKVMPGGKWFAPFALTPGKLRLLDQYNSENINIDGGTWTPSSPLCFGGAGLKLNGIATITGNVTTKPAWASDEPCIELPASAWPAFATPSTRTRSVMVSPVTAGGSAGAPVFFDSAGFPNSTEYTDSGFLGALYPHQLRFHTACTLNKATFYYRYTGTKPAALPGTPELFGIFRTDASNNRTNLSTNGVRSGILYSAGYAVRDGLTVDTWYNSGETIGLEFVPNQNATIATDTYLYTLEIFTPIAADIYGVKLDLTVPDKRHE